MFQFPAFAFRLHGISRLHRDGFPHSEIPGSKVICTFPELIAAYHVLLRLWEPRHPPYALITFLNIILLLLHYYFIQHVKELLSQLRNIVQNNGVEPFSTFISWLSAPIAAFCNFKVCILKNLLKKWRISESNRWPPACKAGALASWANSPEHIFVVPRRFELRTPTLSV
jgi:hypothetical protein